MGNTQVANRFVNFVRRKFNPNRFNLPVIKSTQLTAQRQLPQVSKITDLISSAMPPNRGRTAKATSANSVAAKSKPEKDAESSETEGDATEMAVEAKSQTTKGRKKEQTKENGHDEKPKSARGRKKAEAQEDDASEDVTPKTKGKKKVDKEEAPEELRKSARGKKKEPVKEEIDEEPPKKQPKGRKKPEPVENGEEADEPSQSTKGRKKAEEKTADKKPAARGRKKAAESSEDEEEPEKSPVKRGRKAAVKAAPQEAEDADAAEAEEVPLAKRGRKAAAKAAPQEAEEVDEPEKPAAKRGRKQAEKKPAKVEEKAPKAGRSKRNETPEDDEAEPTAKKAKAEKKKPVNKTDTNLDEIDFSCDKTNAKGDKYNIKICCWNVSGVRALVKKHGMDYILKENADIFMLQETKCSLALLPEELNLPDYKRYYLDSDKSGYAGIALFTKKEPIDVKYGLENSACDDEGRLITAEFDNFYVLNVYVPNAGRGLVTLEKRLKWNEAFKTYVKELDEKKPVIICGDMNVAHEEIDLANPKSNVKNAGFTKEEREGMTDFLAAGFVDTFRQLYPDKTGAYTFWTHMAGARSRNVGWRLDYFIVSERIKDNICDNVMRSEVYGSDHCPIVLYANL